MEDFVTCTVFLENTIFLWVIAAGTSQNFGNNLQNSSWIEKRFQSNLQNKSKDILLQENFFLNHAF